MNIFYWFANILFEYLYLFLAFSLKFPAIEKALKIDSENDKAKILLGRIYLEQKKYGEAKITFASLPETAETLFYLGYAYILAGKNDEALTVVNKSIKLYPAVKETILEAKEFNEIWHLIE